MIIFYPGDQQEQLDGYLKHLKDRNVLLVGDEQKPLIMNDLITKKQEDLGEIHSSGLPFMFWVDENPKDVTDLQKILHEENLDINQMAMKTENNMNWTLEKLYEEVCAEAKWFASREKLADLIKQADVHRLKTEPQYQQAVYTCYMLLQSEEEVPQKLLDMACEMLANANADI